VATEDIVYMFESMGMATGIDLDALVAVARDAAALPGGLPGGRVRAAMTAKAQMQVRSLSSRVWSSGLDDPTGPILAAV
jgi:hypothetical protein